jgi:hypothetical protein
MNIDQLNNANLQDVTTGAFVLVDAMQSMAPGVQPLAAGLLFVALCDAKGITPNRVLEIVTRLRRASDESIDQAHVRAVEQYINEELS